MRNLRFRGINSGSFQNNRWWSVVLNCIVSFFVRLSAKIKRLWHNFVTMGWGNIYKRRMKVFSVAILIYLDYKSVQQKEKWIKKSKVPALWDKAHDRNAKRVLNLIVELEGLWVKLGQYLSTRADVLPQAYISLLTQLQDSLPPRPLPEVRRTIERELGHSMDVLFTDFVDVPLATASIAQVHRATLANGQDVVVKVQHDGIRTIILEDLKNAKSIVDWIAWAEPQYNFNPMIDEWCKEAPRELDFNIEAENTRAVSRNLGCKKTNDGVRSANRVDVLIPDIIQSSESVLILEYMDGIRLNDVESLDAFGVDKQKIVEEITRAYAHQIYVDGFFNGDPHPGNFLVSKEPPHRPILLDFGLTKKLSHSLKQALAKMFLASAEGDQVALLSAFAEMGLKLRLDLPDQAMSVAGLFFRSSTPSNEALKTLKTLNDQRLQNMKVIQEKMQLSQKEVKRFNPIDAFPGDIVIFARVVNLLRGLSSTMNVRIVYLDIMRPFAESVLLGSISRGPTVDSHWIHDSPIHSDVESKLRKLLIELGSIQKILGIQVCAYKDGKVIIDTAAGVLGRYDPRPVQPDSLFPVFSVTKGVTAGMIHWLVDKRKLQLDQTVGDIWPGFGSNGKDAIMVHHVLNHTSGLHSAFDPVGENPLLICDWDECLKRIANSSPETVPGNQQFYHYLTFGWLCGGIVEYASGKKFQEILEESIVKPLKIDGELYIGIPPGVESRLATLTVDTDEMSKLSSIASQPELPSTFQPDKILQLATSLPVLFNTLNVRRAIIPAANGHCSARALARYYATLADGGLVPPPHSSLSLPPLGSHTHVPKFTASNKKTKKRKGKEMAATEKLKPKDHQEKRLYDEKRFMGGGRGRESSAESLARLVNDTSRTEISSDDRQDDIHNLFSNPRIHDAFMGAGDYSGLVMPDGKFGLGFKRVTSQDGSLVGFGHSGMGGSTGFCDIKNRFSIAITLNKMSMGGVTANIIRLVCSELNIPLPKDFSLSSALGPDSEMGTPLIN
ncbi:Protein ACTIVITY OF BC1 COMPLEX KINASE 8 [Cardamine amara subsp. amara]|uniref:Protein ACTIVITY OF BC1 COMPLEX KINASE 8 n=1 Tax=Cardamine amara subsp. amara TaxID=228776 RepID=A0ABD1B192_CARAN